MKLSIPVRGVDAAGIGDSPATQPLLLHFESLTPDFLSENQELGHDHENERKLPLPLFLLAVAGKRRTSRVDPLTLFGLRMTRSGSELVFLPPFPNLPFFPFNLLLRSV